MDDFVQYFLCASKCRPVYVDADYFIAFKLGPLVVLADQVLGVLQLLLVEVCYFFGFADYDVSCFIAAGVVVAWLEVEMA